MPADKQRQKGLIGKALHVSLPRSTDRHVRSIRVASVPAEHVYVRHLPYQFGTHSGWLEACFDVGTTLLAPDCGYFGEQRPCLRYRHDESGLDAQSLRDAVRAGYADRPHWQASAHERRAERADLARAHLDVYAGLGR